MMGGLSDILRQNSKTKAASSSSSAAAASVEPSYYGQGENPFYWFEFSLQGFIDAGIPRP